MRTNHLRPDYSKLTKHSVC